MSVIGMIVYVLVMSCVVIFVTTGFFRDMRKLGIDHSRRMEELTLRYTSSMLKGSMFTDAKISYFIPAEGSTLKNRLLGRKRLYLYDVQTVLTTGRDHLGRSQYYVDVNKKQLFELELIGAVDSHNREAADKARQLLDIKHKFPSAEE